MGAAIPETVAPSRRKDAGAFPFLGNLPRWTFLLHAALALCAVCALNWLVARHVPFAIKRIGDSYLIFFYHFPSAINVFVFYAGLLAASLGFLTTRDPVWDLRARVSCQVGLLANAVLLFTGSTWAKAAWNQWWVWNDPRLMSAAIMSITYLGYLVLQDSVEDDRKRRTFSAVYGCLAFVNIPIVHFAIRWFGEASHPMKLDELSSDLSIVRTRWFGVLVFFLFYLVLYRWKYEREAVRERTSELLQEVRRIEERTA